MAVTGGAMTGPDTCIGLPIDWLISGLIQHVKPCMQTLVGIHHQPSCKWLYKNLQYSVNAERIFNQAFIVERQFYTYASLILFTSDLF